jgi:cytochrome c5
VKWLSLGLVLLIASAGAQQPPAAQGTQVRNAAGGAMQNRSSQSAPEALFVEKCGMCHREMGMGTVILARRMEPARAMLEKRTDLSAELITAAARNGIGNMPRIARGEVSDAQLKIISDYLVKRAP